MAAPTDGDNFSFEGSDDLFSFLHDSQEEWPAFHQELSTIPLPPIVGFETIPQAQTKLVSRLRTGEITTCHCCGQPAGIYKRRITSTMARWLIRLVHRFEKTNDWVHLDDLKKMEGGGDYAKLSIWRLLEHRVNEDTNKTQSGYWKPTPRAIEFAHGNVALPMPAWLYNKRVLGYGDKFANIEECLGKKFTMRDVWASVHRDS